MNEQVVGNDIISNKNSYYLSITNLIAPLPVHYIH